MENKKLKDKRGALFRIKTTRDPSESLCHNCAMILPNRSCNVCHRFSEEVYRDVPCTVPDSAGYLIHINHLIPGVKDGK